MFYRYDEIVVMTKAHMDDLKYDQQCCLRARKIRQKKNRIRKTLVSVLSALAPVGFNN